MSEAFFLESERFPLFGVNYAVASMAGTVAYVREHLDALKGNYICFSDTHTMVMAREHEEYREILNGAALVFADGHPIAKRQRKGGHPEAERIAGPDFMKEMFAAEGLSHFFYGATEEALAALKKNLEKDHPGIDIRGMLSPPFRKLSEEEDASDVARINASGADIIWIGLGAPKQEKWMKAHKGRIDGVMMGVGAGFDFHAGTIKRAPRWIQKIGFEWLYRLFQDPKRLFRRYLVTNSKYFFYSIRDKFKK